MKKLLLLLSLTVVVLVGLSGCNNEPSSAKDLKGNWYACELPSKGSSDYWGKAYHFVNDNTVTYYNYVSGSPRWDYSESLSGAMKGYYVQQGGGETYTYEVIDNKIYIPMQGKILTIDGKNLYWEGSSAKFSKM